MTPGPLYVPQKPQKQKLKQKHKNQEPDQSKLVFEQEPDQTGYWEPGFFMDRTGPNSTETSLFKPAASQFQCRFPFLQRVDFVWCDSRIRNSPLPKASMLTGICAKIYAYMYIYIYIFIYLLFLFCCCAVFCFAQSVEIAIIMRPRSDRKSRRVGKESW